LALISIFFWNLKDFFDDMKAYEVDNIEGFSLFPTVFLGVFLTCRLLRLLLWWALIMTPSTRYPYIF